MRSFLFGLFSAVLVATTIGQHASAQGYPNCYNAQGYQVGYYPDPSINDVAIATTFANGAPVVLWNPGIINSLQPETVEFFYYHECAHHAMGHPLGNYGPGGEIAADCWGKSQMINFGVLTPQKYAVIRNELIQYSTPGMDWANGYERVQYLDNC